MNEIDEIRKEMARIRHDLNEDVTGVVGGASEVLDWRSFWRSHPWIMSGVAIAVGYYLVPKRSKEVESVRVPTPYPMETGTSRTSTQLAANGDQKASKQSLFSPWRMIGWAISFAGPLALNAAQAYASVWLENQLGIRQKGPGGTSNDIPRDRTGRQATDFKGSTSSSMYRSPRA